MTDDEFQAEATQLKAIGDVDSLNHEIGTIKRRQLDSAAHATLIGVAVAHALDRGWVDKGKAAFEAYCKGKWGYSVTQINSYRRLAKKGWKATRRAQDTLLAHITELPDDVKLPEVGSVGFAEKAIKFQEEVERERILYPDMAEDELINRAADAVLKPKAKAAVKAEPNEAGDQSVEVHYRRLLAMFAVIVSRSDNLEMDVLRPLAKVAAFHLETMDTINDWLTNEFERGAELDTFFEDQNKRVLDALKPPWIGQPPHKPAIKPVHVPNPGGTESVPPNETGTKKRGRPAKAPGEKKRSKQEITTDTNRAFALHVARDVPGNWVDVGSRVKGDVEREGWVIVQVVTGTDLKQKKVPEITDKGSFQLALYEAAEDTPTPWVEEPSQDAE